MASTITFQNDPGGGGRTKVVVPAGETSPPISLARKSVVTVAPGNAGSALVEATWSFQADIDGGTATWFPWDAGTVTTKANQMVELASAVRFTATGAACVAEVSR